MLQSDFPGTIGTCEPLLSFLPRRSSLRAEVLTLLGLAHGMLHHYQESYDLFTEALTIDPTNGEVWYNRGLACRFTTRFGQAVQDFERAVALSRNETSELTRTFITEWEISRKDLEEAMREHGTSITLEQFIEREERFMHAMSLMRQSKWQEAELAFRQVIEMGGGLPHFWGNLGVSLIMQTRYEEAEAALRRALEMDPHYTLARTNLEKIPDVRRAGGPLGIELRELSQVQGIKQSIAFSEQGPSGSSPTTHTTIEKAGNALKRTGKLLGKQPPRYRFFLNPYRDARFTTCPQCGLKTRQRQCPLVIHEEAVYDDYYEEEGYYPEEEGLEGLVVECIEALGSYLADEQTDRVAREKSIAVLLAIYQRDLHADDSHGFAERAADQLVRYTTPLERQTIAEWIREALADEEQEITGSERQAYGKFWLDLQNEALDDEAYLRICRETGRISDLVDRLLALGRIDEAAQETRRADDYSLLGLANLFIQHGQDAVAECLMKARISAPIRPAKDAAGLVLRSQPGRAEEEKPDWRVLEWLQKYYRDRGNHAAELEMAQTLFRTQPSLKRYQELRDLSGRLDRWEGPRRELLAFLEQAKNTSLLIQIALDEGDIDQALQRLQGTAKKDGYGYTYIDRYGYYGYSDVAFEVARAAEETRPHAAIELYRQFAERLIAMRDRKRYELACTYLVKVRALYEKLGDGEAWTSYVTALREQNRNLRALKEELAEAGL